MTRSHPSSLVLALLRIVESNNEALAGDLVEEWRAGRSTRWLWSQVVRAVLVTIYRKPASSRPPLLRESVSSERPDPTLMLIDPATMNLRGFRVRSVGGGGLLGSVLLITIVLPQASLLVLTGIVGGLVIALTTIARRRDRGLAGPDGAAPLSLFGTTNHTSPREAGRRPSGLIRLAIA